MRKTPPKDLTDEDVQIETPTLPPFTYSRGYEVSFIDMGDIGIKIEMNHSPETSRAIILPLKETDELNQWLNRRIGCKHKKPPGRRPGKRNKIRV